MLGGYEHEDLGLVPSTIRQLTMAHDSKPGALISPLAFKGTRDACDIQTCKPKLTPIKIKCKCNYVLKPFPRHGDVAQLVEGLPLVA